MQTSIEGFRLSPQQRRLWLLGAGGPAYVAQCAVRIEGDLDAARLRAAFAEAVARHEILRTTFYRPPGIKLPIQIIADSAAPAWREVQTGGETDEELDALLSDEAREPFDFERGPLLRLALLKLDARRHLLAVTLPSLCADARTLANLFKEVTRAYAASAHDDDGEPVQYVQFAEWQNELLEGEEGAAAGREHWAAPRWEGLAPPPLPSEAAAPTRADFAPLTHALDFGPELAAKVLAAASTYNADAHDFLHACWQTLLWRLSGEREFVLGLRVSGRKYEELEEACGPFEKFVPLRAALAGGLAFDALVGRVREASAEAASWQEYFAAGDDAKGANGPDGDPRFAVCFESADWPAGVNAGGATFTIRTLRSCADRFKLKLSCARLEDSLRAELLFDPAAFDAEGVRAIAERFAALVASAADAESDARLRDLDILSDDDRRLLRDLNRSAADYPHDACAHELFEARAALAPDSAAVRFGDALVTYAELNRRANRLAHALRRRGVGPDVPVALCVERSAQMIVGLLGILKSGGAYVPLDPDHPKARLDYQLEDTRAPVLVTHRSLRERFADFKGDVLCLDEEAAFASEPAHNPVPIALPQNLAYVIYTSGSTGRPKGVGVSHASLVNYSYFIGAMLRPLLADGVGAAHFATVTTLSADLGNTSVFPSLFSGGCLHVLGYEVATDGQAFTRYASESPLDVLKIVPSHLRALLASQESLNSLPLACLVLGGEALAPELVAAVREGGAACRVVNHYGPTETTVGSLTHLVTDDAADSDGARTVPVGRPVANTEVYVLDAEMNPQPPGVPGELFIGGAGLARGYLHKPAQTAERFVPHASDVRSGARLYRTGDLVRCLPSGEIEFLGRVDHQVKVRGFRIELGEIETALAAHTDVREAVVVAREDEPGRKRLVAYVVSERRTHNLTAELRAHLAERLPDYMTPAAFVPLKALPLTRNGKVDRAALPAPGQAALDGERAYVAPRSEAERALASIWAQALGVERVGVHDNFFELGGDSILSIQVVARAKQAGIGLTLKQLFDHRTIDGLAGVVTVTKVSTDGDGAHIGGEFALTPAQRRLLEHGRPDPDNLIRSQLFEPAHTLDAARLRDAVVMLFERHDQLRATFTHDEARGWLQHIAPHDAESAAAAFEHQDLSNVAPDEQAATLEAEVERLRRGFDLARGPLLRVALFELGGRRQRLLVVAHALVVDDASLGIILEDLQTAYAQSELAPKTASFRSWAEHLQSYAQTAEVRAQAAYWLSAGRAGVTPLPTDAGGENTFESERRVTVALSAGRTRSLLQDVGRAYGNHVEEVLLAAVGEALRRWSGARRVLVELEGRGREGAGEGAPDVSRTVGPFAAPYPLLLQAPEAFEPGVALRLVKEQLRVVPGGGLGYGLLRYLSDDVAVRESLRALPRAGVSFKYVGRRDGVNDDARLAPAREPADRKGSPHTRRECLLDIEARVEGEGLQLVWNYSEAAHRRETVERVARECLSVLEELIGHCLAAEGRGYTPSDFPLAGLDERRLNAVIGKVKGRQPR